ncbi:uracil-DNA glycosylase [Pseudoroseicyclus tamaricis]|uniref:Uracil-DNA glycosylase n=1 Tax=Pseudoroseicyclus tamaricis TaxID=2705421 RepID=A0A6B2K198_9RHOB|nr:uracil-DNA glycosylase [Pseudoroseicyclus tamaricis]NDV01482.1 uracil-DNA glycosylase [Pseudoroseicyclus tamaricis]
MSAPALAGWEDLAFWQTGWPAVSAALAAEERQILPPAPQIFAALDHLRPEDVRVLILGQDPYPTPGHAHGHAFSVEPHVRPLPRSLSNIFKEMQGDLACCPATGDLRHWADQGVMLLNTALTVPAGEAGGHARLGWLPLVREVVARVSTRPTAFLLWGKTAQKLGADEIRPGEHLVIETAHPSPLSARRGFFGSRPFSRVNAWLAARGEAEIDWAGPLPSAPGEE